MDDNKVAKFPRIGATPAKMLENLLADADNLEGIMVVCIWKGDQCPTTTGWSKDIRHSELVYGARCLSIDVDQVVFPHTHTEDQIEY